MTENREQAFDTESGYLAAIDATLAATRRDICVFDCDLVRMGLEQPARCEVLGHILSSRPDTRLCIVLHDPQPLERSSPRLLQLLRRHADRMEVRQTPKQLRHLADSFLLGDSRHGVVRFHAQQARGKFFIDAIEAARPWQSRFEELRASASICVAATRLGL